MSVVRSRCSPARADAARPARPVPSAPSSLRARRRAGAAAALPEDSPEDAGLDEEGDAPPASGRSFLPPRLGQWPGQGPGNPLTALWQRDVAYVGDRAGRDSERARNGLQFWRELLRATFGQGERPALQAEMERLKVELETAKQQAKLSELRLFHTSARISELERGKGSATASAASVNNWQPLISSSSLGSTTALALWYKGQPWVLFRDATGAPSCVLDECAHRACPLSLGKVVGGAIQCPYHGWEYDKSGACTHMPSTKLLPGVVISALPCVEAEGWLWAWATEGASTPAATLPRAPPPPGFTLVADVELEMKGTAEKISAALQRCAEHPEAVARGRTLRAALRAAKGGSSELADSAAADEAAAGGEEGGAASIVSAAARTLLGGWESARSLTVARPSSAIVLSTIQLAGADAAEDEEEGEEEGTLHQMHVVLPSRPGSCRVLFRLSGGAANGWGGGLVTSRLLWQSVATELLKEQILGGAAEAEVALN